MMKVIQAVFFGLMLSIASCAQKEIMDSEKKEFLRPSEVIRHGRDYLGQTINMRGYLDTFSEIYLFDTKNGFEKRSPVIFSEQAIIVLDNSKDNRIWNEGYDREKKCTGNFAEVSGVIDWSEGFQNFVVWDLLSITIYDSKDFEEGIVCYEKSADSVEYEHRIIQ